MPYEMEFRIAVAAAHAACGSSIEVAEDLGCSESWVRWLVKGERETGSLAPKPPVLPDNNKLDEADLEKIRRLVAERPDILLKELAEALGNKVSVPTVHRATRRLGLSRKKSPSAPPSRTGPT